MASSPLSESATSSTAAWERSRATPPPGTTPSSMAALVVLTRVFDAVLLLLQLHLGGGADLEHGNAADSLARRSCSFSRS